MREIKFRGKSLNDNQWHYGDLVKAGGKTYIHPQGNTFERNGEVAKIVVMHEVSPKTVCQYTGMKDKNCREIYEGDLVIITAEDGVFEIVWDTELARFILESDDLIMDFDNCYEEDVEVIGNKVFSKCYKKKLK